MLMYVAHEVDVEVEHCAAAKLLLVVDEVLEIEDALLDVVEEDKVEVDVALVAPVDVELVLVDDEVVLEDEDDV